MVWALLKMVYYSLVWGLVLRLARGVCCEVVLGTLEEQVSWVCGLLEDLTQLVIEFMCLWDMWLVGDGG